MGEGRNFHYHVNTDRVVQEAEGGRGGGVGGD